MNSSLPEYFFRVRENGATVFLVETDNPQRRIEMTQIAVLNIKNGEIKPHGGRVLSNEDREEIEAWMAKRKAQLGHRDLDDLHRAVENLNLTAQWAQSRATPEQLEDITDELLLAMHDLRSVLVRKKADRMSKTLRAAKT